MSQRTLKGMGKAFNYADKYKSQVEKLHGFGIAIQACFVFGFDTDDESVFDRTVDRESLTPEEAYTREMHRRGTKLGDAKPIESLGRLGTGRGCQDDTPTHIAWASRTVPSVSFSHTIGLIVTVCARRAPL